MSPRASRSPPATGFLPRQELQGLIDALLGAGYRVLGPRVRDGALLLGEIQAVGDMTPGAVEEQGPGRYRIGRQEGSDRLFAWTTGPQALKPLAFAPEETLWRVERGPDGALAFETRTPAPRPTAVVGIRACDLAGLALQDAHFLRGPEPEPHYRARRASLLLVAVDCQRSAPTCFCASTGDGPALSGGFDIGLTELDEGFLVRPGSGPGRRVLQGLDLQPASEDQLDRGIRQAEAAAAGQVRRMPEPVRLRELLAQLDHPRWQEVAGRCLACGNCTSVCPTCFCHDTEIRGSLDGGEAEQVRRWDSCFSRGHSELHGRPVRPDIRSRYRQWATHKLAGWQTQYGRSGCVGCGRCITWCPVGIDIVEEANAVLEEGP